MKMIEKDHWTDLIMDSVGDDPEKAQEFYTQFKLWRTNTIIAIGVTFALMSLGIMGFIFGMYWCGYETENPPGEREIIAIAFLWMGALMGAMCTIMNGSLEIRLRKHADNTKYYTERIEKERGDDQCK